MSTPAKPTAGTVGVVVVNYGGGDLTFRCLQSLLASEWPAEQLRIVLVDNPVDGALTSDGLANRVATQLPAVRVIHSSRNRGFAGGCNLGMQELPDTDFVALVNNDATVEPGWLAPLIAALRADETRGGACPKILFATPYVELALHSRTHRRGRGDRRDLGVRVSGARVGTDDAWSRVQLVDGFWGTEPTPADEPGAQWTASTARLRLPMTPMGATPEGVSASLRLAADEPTSVTISSGDQTVALDVATTPTWHDLPLAGPPLEIINNVGTVLNPDGSGADRGFLEPDDGRFDDPVDVEAWCGAAVLLSRAYLDDVEGFDERLFLYYEDVELSVRGSERGWHYRYVPESVVRHVHSATSVEGSSLARYYNERNRLLVLARHESLGHTLRASGRTLLVTGSYAKRDIISPVLHGRRPHAEIVTSRLESFAGFLRKAPAMRRSGRRD